MDIPTIKFIGAIYFNESIIVASEFSLMIFTLDGNLVETIFDAIHTLKSSQLEYLYLPELGKLIKLSNEK